MYRRADLGVVGALLLLAFGASRVSLAEEKPQKPRSPQEERRRKLLKEMGLEKNDQSAKTAPAPSSTEGDAAAGTPAPSGATDELAPRAPAGQKRDKGTGDNPPRSTSTPGASPSFRRVIHPLLMQTCKPCHAAGGVAGATPFLLSGEPGPDHTAVMRVLDARAPVASVLLEKASGQKTHAGGALWPSGGGAYGRVLAWIQGGARLDGSGSSAAVGVEPAVPVPAPTPLPTGPRGAAPRATRAAPATSPTSATGAGIPAPDEITESAAAPAAVPAAEVGAAPENNRVDVGVDFVGQVHPLLMRTCSTCHSPVGPAAATRLVLSGEVRNDYGKVRGLVDPAAPAESVLILKGSGEGHAGGPAIPAGSPGYMLLLAWVKAGATEHLVAAPGATASALPAPPSDAAAAGSPGTSAGVPDNTAAATSAVSPAGARGGAGLGLPYGLALDGRFDIAYERRGFSGSPFVGSAANALRSYHHFLFLSRESTDDPFGLSIEMLSLQFWETHVRWRAKCFPVQVVVAGGKILVPFGADPLMHQSYGGLSGFDQRILPVIWAQEGVAAHVLVHRDAWAITDDLYVVRGYTLKRADGIINLQSDFSPDDNARLGWGNRLGAAWGSLSAWYSAYYNPLGFGRRLFMQAADVMLWRLRQIPVLGHFSFAAGLLRADVSGGDDQGSGGSGKDYYHFASYLQLRYHPTDWLYVQYREGLRTFNNRRGVFVDDTRLTRDDGSTHNFGVVARTHGLTAGIYYFVNLEKVDEVPNDLLRVSMSYDF